MTRNRRQDWMRNAVGDYGRRYEVHRLHGSAQPVPLGWTNDYRAAEAMAGAAVKWPGATGARIVDRQAEAGCCA